MEARIKTHGDELQKAYLDGKEYTKSFLQPEVRKSCFKAFVDVGECLGRLEGAS